jgi:tRNA dimethylallyltransferase
MTKERVKEPVVQASGSIDKPRADELCVVVGPTASGKTDLAIELCERFDGEIVGADSVQVYRGLDIGSGKPTPIERSRARHHLIDVRDASDPIDASQFVELADAAIDDIRGRGKTPIVCGGTFLWVKALTRGLVETPPADPAIRARHAALRDAEGRAALHQMLHTVDPGSAARLAPNDFVRVSRALEVHQLTGRPLTELQQEHGFQHAYRDFNFYGVAWSKAELALRIESRVRGMLEAGWVSEVSDLLARGYGDTRAMGAVGYRTIKEALLAGAPLIDDALLAESISRMTRIFARRQRTWLRDEPIAWLAPGTLPDISAL